MRPLRALAFAFVAWSVAWLCLGLFLDAAPSHAEAAWIASSVLVSGLLLLVLAEVAFRRWWANVWRVNRLAWDDEGLWPHDEAARRAGLTAGEVARERIAWQEIESVMVTEEWELWIGRSADVLVLSPQDPERDAILQRLRSLQGWKEEQLEPGGWPLGQRAPNGWEVFVAQGPMALSSADFAEIAEGIRRAPPVAREPWSADATNDGLEMRVGADTDLMPWQRMDAVLVGHDPRNEDRVRTWLRVLSREKPHVLVVPCGAGRFDAVLHELPRQIEGVEESGLRVAVEKAAPGEVVFWRRPGS